MPPYYRRYVDDTLTVMPDTPTAVDFLNTLKQVWFWVVPKTRGRGAGCGLQTAGCRLRSAGSGVNKNKKKLKIKKNNNKPINKSLGRSHQGSIVPV